jgi:hypothetical protein
MGKASVAAGWTGVSAGTPAAGVSIAGSVGGEISKSGASGVVCPQEITRSAKTTSKAKIGKRLRAMVSLLQFILTNSLVIQLYLLDNWLESSPIISLLIDYSITLRRSYRSSLVYHLELCDLPEAA